VVVSIVVVSLASGANHSGSGKSTAVNWITLILGFVFLLLAARQWQSRPKPGVEAPMPKWMQAIDQFTPLKSAGLGVALSAANPKNLALTVAAAGSIAQAGLSGGGTSVAILVFVVIASLTVAGPVVFFLFARERAAGPLESVKQFMSDHNAVIMMVVLLILGAKLIGNGIGGLSS
jgi:threonine/homoserine/homoserine lactone efflux protein